MTPELETLLRIYELLGETPDSGLATMRVAFKNACMEQAARSGVDWRELKRFVEKMHERKIVSENRRTGRPAHSDHQTSH